MQNIVMQVFISYTRENQDFAERLASDLRNHQIDVWIDVQIQAGTNWREAIVDGIRNSEVVIICLSPEAVESDWVRREIFLARSLNKRMLPLTIKHCFEHMQRYEDTKELLSLQIVNFQENYKEAFRLLMSALATKERVLDVEEHISLTDFRRFLRSM